MPKIYLSDIQAEYIRSLLMDKLCGLYDNQHDDEFTEDENNEYYQQQTSILETEEKLICSIKTKLGK